MAKQRQLCLGAGHDECATFKAARALMAVPSVGPFEAGLWPRSTSRVVTLEPVRSGRAGGLTSPRARAGGQALLVGLIVVAFAVLVVARTSPAPGGAAGQASPVPSVAAGATGSPPAPATAGPSQAPASPPTSASPGATSSAGASAATGQTYKVKRGDTLAAIALKFGVSLKALRKANGLKPGAVIRRGQVLVIPAPGPTATP